MHTLAHKSKTSSLHVLKIGFEMRVEDARIGSKEKKRGAEIHARNLPAEIGFGATKSAKK